MLNMSCPFPTDKDDGSEVFNVIESFFHFTVRDHCLRKRLRELSAGGFQVRTVFQGARRRKFEGRVRFFGPALLDRSLFEFVFVNERVGADGLGVLRVGDEEVRDDSRHRDTL